MQKTWKYLLSFALLVQVLPFVCECFVGTSPCDSSFFRYIGQQVAEGGVLYQCAWDNKGPVLFVPQLLGWLLFPHWSNHGPGFVIMVMCVCTVCFLFGLGRKLGLSLFASAVGVAIYSVCVYVFGGIGAQNNQEDVALFFVAFGLVVSFDTKSIWKNMFFGICVACVFFVKPNLVSFSVAIFALWLYDKVMTKDELTFWTRIVGSFVGFAGCLLAVTGVFAIYGAAYDMWDASLLFGLFEYCKTDEPLMLFWIRCVTKTFQGWNCMVYGCYVGLVLLSIGAAGKLYISKQKRLTLFFLVWIAFEMLMIFSFKTFYGHYLIVASLPLSLAVAFLIEEDGQSLLVRMLNMCVLMGLMGSAFWITYTGMSSVRRHGIYRDYQRPLREKIAELTTPGEQVACLGAFEMAETLTLFHLKTIQHFNAGMNYHFSQKPERKSKIANQVEAMLNDRSIKYLIAVTNMADLVALPFVKDGISLSKNWRLVAGNNHIGLYSRCTNDPVGTH